MTAYISARDANQGFSELLGRAANGERVIITRRGKPVAELRPFDGSEDEASSQAAWKQLMDHLQEGVHLGGEKFDRDSLYDR